MRSRPGAGTTVVYVPTARLPAHWHGDRPATRPEPELDLRPGWPDLSAFPRRAWAAVTGDVLKALPDAELGYIEPWAPGSCAGSWRATWLACAGP